MADDDQKNSPFGDSSKDVEGLDETTGEIEEDATRQITGDALKQIRESASHDMAPEWLDKMRDRKREAEKREEEDFDTPVPDEIESSQTPRTEQMDPDHVGSLTEGMVEGSAPGLEEITRDGDTTEIERDSTKAINRGDLDSLMKEKGAELEESEPAEPSEPAAPQAGVISKTSRSQTERPTRDVDDDASAAVAESEADEKSSPSFSLPKPKKRSSKSADQEPAAGSAEEAGLDEDSFGDFSDEDLHAVVFGDEDEQPQEEDEASTGAQPRVAESPALDFSDISDEEEPEPESETQTTSEPVTGLEEPDLAATGGEAPEDQPLEAPSVSDEEEAPEEPLTELQGEASEDEQSTELEVEPPEDFPDYESETQRPVIAAIAGFVAALSWIVGGALAMFTSLPSPWESLVPPICLGAGVVSFLLVMVAPPKWIESGILAVLGIGIGGFALVQWSSLGTINITDYLGMAPLVGAGLAIVAAIATLVRPSGYIADF